MFWGSKDGSTSFNIQIETHSSRFIPWEEGSCPRTHRPSSRARWNYHVTAQKTPSPQGRAGALTATPHAAGTGKRGCRAALPTPSLLCPEPEQENTGTSCHFIRKSTVQNSWAASKVTPMMELKKTNSIQRAAGTHSAAAQRAAGHWLPRHLPKVPGGAWRPALWDSWAGLTLRSAIRKPAACGLMFACNPDSLPC